MTKAETLTLTFVIRPSYAEAATVLREIEESLEWLSLDHHAVSLVTVSIGEGHWLEEDAE